MEWIATGNTRWITIHRQNFKPKQCHHRSRSCERIIVVTDAASKPKLRFIASVCCPNPWNIPQSSKYFLPLFNVIRCFEPVTVLAAPWNAIFIFYVWCFSFSVFGWEPSNSKPKTENQKHFKTLQIIRNTTLLPTTPSSPSLSLSHFHQY